MTGGGSIDLNRSNNDIGEEILEETAIERNARIYGSNNINILKVGDTVISIENMMESGIVVAFENERNNMLIRVELH